METVWKYSAALETMRWSLAQKYIPVIDADEKVLLDRCRAGEAAAFNALLERYRGQILNLCYQILGDADSAEDAAQDVFLQAFSSLGKFRGDAAFFTWLYRIAINVCCARRRKCKLRMRRKENRDIPTHNSSLERKVVQRIAVQRALNKLSPKLRTVLILREMHELSYEEIAEILQLPLGTVRSRLHEGRRRFQQIWEK